MKKEKKTHLNIEKQKKSGRTRRRRLFKNKWEKLKKKLK